MGIDFRLSRFLHPAAILRLRRSMERTQWLPDQQRHAWRDARLSAITRHAALRVPYYRALYRERGLAPEAITGVDDLQRLPILDRATLRREADRLQAGDAQRHGPASYRTSGSSGEPVEFLLDRHAEVLEFVYYWRHWGWAGYRLGDPFAQLSLGFFLGRPGREQDCWAWQPHIRRLVLNPSQLSPRRAAELARGLRKHRPRFLKGLPSSIFFLGSSLAEAGIDDLQFEALFTTSELLTPGTRRAIRGFFGGPVLDSYGHMERTVAISQCPRGSYHVHDDYGVMELSEPRPAHRPGLLEASPLGTGLFNKAMPLIRYAIGDRILFEERPKSCPCGRTLPVVEAIAGRSEDVIITPDGRHIATLFVLPELAQGVRFLQVVQPTRRRLQLRVEPAPDWDEGKREGLERELRRVLGPDMKLEFEIIGPEQRIRDPSGKLRVVISQLTDPRPDPGAQP